MPAPDKPIVVRGWVPINPDGTVHRNKYSKWIVFFPTKACLTKWGMRYIVRPAIITLEPKKARKRK